MFLKNFSTLIRRMLTPAATRRQAIAMSRIVATTIRELELRTLLAAASSTFVISDVVAAQELDRGQQDAVFAEFTIVGKGTPTSLTLRPTGTSGNVNHWELRADMMNGQGQLGKRDGIYETVVSTDTVEDNRIQFSFGTLGAKVVKYVASLQVVGDVTPDAAADQVSVGHGVLTFAHKVKATVLGADPVVHKILPAADLKMSITGAPVVHTWDTERLNVEVSNLSQTVSHDVKAEVVIPAGAVWDTSTADTGWYQSGASMVFVIGDIQPGAIVYPPVLSMIVGSNAHDYLNFAAVVTSTTFDPQEGNNYSVTTAQVLQPVTPPVVVPPIVIPPVIVPPVVVPPVVIPPVIVPPVVVPPVITGTADISVLLTGPDTAQEGKKVNYWFTVQNFGPSDASGVKATLTVPIGFIFDTVLSDPALYQEVGNPQRLAFDLTLLRAAQNQTLGAVFTVSGAIPGSQRFDAQASSLNSDPDASNDTAFVNTNII